jgi:hypothetical protein
MPMASPAWQGLAIAPDAPWVRINLAHALLLLDRATEAQALYEQIAAEIRNKPFWKQIVVDDFGKLRKVGVTHRSCPQSKRPSTANRDPYQNRLARPSPSRRPPELQAGASGHAAAAIRHRRPFLDAAGRLTPEPRRRLAPYRPSPQRVGARFLAAHGHRR